MTNFHQMRERLLDELNVPSPVVPLVVDWHGAENLSLSIKRDDCIHPIISGNKWRKLADIFLQMTAPPPRVLSFGGGFSNHLHALGYVCHRLGIPFTAIVRGDYSRTPPPMLRDLSQWHTDIQYVTKHEFRQRNTPAYTAALQARYPGAMLIPEGGSQRAALAGVSQLIREQPVPFDTVLCPVASGATLAGIISALTPDQHALGVGVLQGEGYLESLVTKLLPDAPQNWHIEHRYTHGGYAKTSPELLGFCDDFERQTGIPVEPVYSGKLLFALKQMIAHGQFMAGHRLLIVHTGGLQGARWY